MRASDMEIHGSGGKEGGGGNTPTVAKNTLFSDATVRIVDVIGAGRIGGLLNGEESIFFDGVRLKNADGSRNWRGVQAWQRRGQADQDPVPEFNRSTSEQSVGTEITHVTPVTVTINDDQVDDLFVKISVPALYVLHTKTGDIRPSAVTLDVWVQASGQPDFTHAKRVTIKGKTDQAYERMIRIAGLSDFGPAPWLLRVSRDTPDPAQQDAATPNTEHVTATYFSSYSLVINERFIMPDVAYVAIKARAKQFGNKIPVRSYLVRGRDTVKIPTNYDPITRLYGEIWDGTFKTGWTDNPAWVIYDLLTNSAYGMGLPASQVDRYALYSIAQYCDEPVKTGYRDAQGNQTYEPRYTCNLCLNSQEEAFHLLNAVAGACATMIFWSSGWVTFAQDAPSNPSHPATRANVVGGRFAYSGAALTARHSVALVSWNDPADHYRPAIELVEDPELIAKYGWNKIDVVATGCTRRGQAHRYGRYILETEKRQTETVTFRGGFEFFDAFPGSIIEVADPAHAGVRFGGRIHPTVQNYLSYSTDFSKSAWTKTNLTVMPCPEPPGNFDTGPFDDRLAMLVLETATTGQHNLGHSAVTRPAVESHYTLSCFVKASGRDYCKLLVQTDSTNYQYVKFDLANRLSSAAIQGGGGGVIYVDSGLQNLGGGWFRIWCTFNVGASFTLLAGRLQLADAYTNNTSYLGDTSKGLYVYQVQLVDGDKPGPLCYTDDEGNPSGITSTAIPLDAPVTLQAGQTYKLSLVMPDKSLVEDLSVINTQAKTQRLRLSQPLSTLPEPGAIWVLTGSNVEPRLFRVLSNVESAANEREITALLHDPNKYAAIEENLVLDAPPTTVFPSGPIAQVQGFKWKIYTRLVAANHRLAVILSWKHIDDPRVITYDVDWRHPDGSWHAVGETMSTSIDFLHVGEPGPHEFRIRGRGIGTGPWTEMTADIVPPDPPSAVTGLNTLEGSYAFSGRNCRLVWDSVVGRDKFPQSRFLHYLVRIKTTGDVVKHTARVKDEKFVYTYRMNDEDFGSPVRTFKVGVAAVDIFLQESPETVVTVSNPAPSMALFAPVTSQSNNKGIHVQWSDWMVNAPRDVLRYRVLLDTDNPPVTQVAVRGADQDSYFWAQAPLQATGINYYVRIVPVDVYGDGLPSQVTQLTHNPGFPWDVVYGSARPEDYATLGAKVGVNLRKSDGATLVTEQDLFLDGLWARAITLTDGGYFRTGLSPDPRIIISKGQIAGFSNETTKEFYLLASTGKAYLGGGNVILESTGVRILPVTGQTWDSTRSVNWGTNVSYPIARIWAWNDTFDDSLVIEVNGDCHFSQGGHMYFRAYGVGSGNHSTIKFNTSNDSYAVALEMNTESDGRFRVDADVIQLKTTPSGGGIVNIDAYTINLGGVVTILAGQIKSTLETGTAPMTVASTTKVTNLNADQVDGKDAADFFPVAGGQLTGANISRNSDDTYLNIHGATNVTSGAGVTLYGRDHATYAGNMYLTFGGYASTGKLVIRNRNASEYNNVFEIDSVGNIVTSALRIGAYVNDSYLSICAGEDGLKGASLVMYGRAHASVPGEAFLTLGGYTAYGKFTIRQRLTDESIVNLFCFDKDANLRIGGTTFGTSAARVLCVGTGTAPTSSPADAFQMYSKDITAGNAAPHFRLEGGPEIRLYQQPHIADPDADSTSLQTAVKAILVALENMRFLATS